MGKISLWVKENKIRFNEQISKSMVLARRKTKQRKKLEIYLYYKHLLQVSSFKYSRITLANKLIFRDHVTAIFDKCSKLIFTLSISAKIIWRLNYAALKTLYTGGILPLLLYGAPVWVDAINKASYKLKIKRVQRMIKVRIARAYPRVWKETLCLI